MKKLANLLSWAMMAVMAVALTSCEDDYWYYDDPPAPWHGDYYKDAYVPDDDNSDYLISMASVLRGQWDGTIKTEYVDDYGQTQRGTYGADFQFDQYKANTINGRGREIDYADTEEVYNMRFSWYIDEKTEDIYLKFDDGREMLVTSFHLDDNSFYGTMESVDGLEVDEFNLTRYTFSNKGLVFDVE